MKFGIIADDFTGATDVAGLLVAKGIPTTQFVGVPTRDVQVTSPAVIVSLKSRSCTASDAVEESLAALEWLRSMGANRIYQKYCSTFDSTSAGNIGPVADALMDELGTDLTVVCPALPVNGRTIYHGYLFANGVLLEESGMRNHPVTPMTDSHLGRLMEAQSRGRTGIISVTDVDGGAACVRARLRELAENGIRYAVLDAIRQEHLDTLAEAVYDLPLTTGGSGLAATIGQSFIDGRVTPDEAAAEGKPCLGPAVILSGSCSEMTQAQVAEYASDAPALAVEVARCVDDSHYAQELADWVLGFAKSPRAPLLYATTEAESLSLIQRRFGRKGSQAIESTFGKVARILADEGYVRFIVAGGETSGAVVQALGVPGFHIGPQIAPGVPWVRSIDGVYSMALKSGNFGSEQFFFDCQESEK